VNRDRASGADLGPLFGGRAPESGMMPDPSHPPDPSARILVGTSGYSFRDWVGPFYPPGMKSSGFLRHYAAHFPVVEVNATYYAIPDPGVTERMAAKTPDGFRFIVKLHQSMTHEGNTSAALYRQFGEAIAPLRDARPMDGLLAQFPWAFRRTPGNESHLGRMRDRLPGENLFVEFRHDSWATPDLESRLRALGVGYCSVDEPALDGLMPPLALRTGDDAYVRFHGRNARTWWGHGEGDRYDYDYAESELREWIDRVRSLAEQSRRTYLFFNNCHAGQAARNAKLMQELLKQQNLEA
jgi:uncharacterized protein YecE (DUF72 family)